MTGQLGYTFSGQSGERYRFTGGPAALGNVIDILEHPAPALSVMGAGSIHHVAFRVPDDLAQLDYQKVLRLAGVPATQVRNRSYFHSIYFREPGGVLFEIATNNPGFEVDEPSQTLGESLKLPSWLEAMRPDIENELAPLTLKPVQKVEYDR